MICGPISQVLVVDVDTRRIDEKAARWLDEREFPNSLTCLTGRGDGGFHVYYRLPEAEGLSGFFEPVSGVEIRGESHYCLVPPSAHPETGKPYVWQDLGGRLPLPDEIVPAPGWLLELLRDPVAEQWLRRALEKAHVGTRHTTWVWAACHMRDAHVPKENALRKAEEYAQRVPQEDHPFPPEEAKAITESLYQTAPRQPLPSKTDRPEHDYGHAQVLSELFRGRLRWSEGRQKWMVYRDGVWRPVGEELVARLASEALQESYQTALSQATSPNDLKGFARKLAETFVATRVQGALFFLRGFEGFYTPPEAWDADGYLLNTPSGTLDLRTGALKPHHPDDLLTRQTRAPYDPYAHGPLWEAHLRRFLPSARVRRQVQRDLGRALVGVPLEESLPIWFGTGANAKTTTLRVVEHVLGDYAAVAPPHLFVETRFEEHPTRLADLWGRRLVFSSEIPEDGRLDEALVKMLTGGENLKARFMRGDYFEFPATASFVLVLNHLPLIRGTDEGLWRRLRVVPFEGVLPPHERKPQAEVVEQLTAEGAAILRWLVEGFEDWKQDPSWVAEECRLLTAEFRAAQDRLKAFLEECCEEGPFFKTSAKALYERYLSWCEEASEEPLSKTAVGKQLRLRGFRAGREYARGRVWLGLRLVGGAS